MFPFENVLFEVFSAIGTVGMSTGITRELNTASRIIIILLMYCGRVGSLSFAVAFARRNKVARVISPKEKVVVG
jgi:trk system potassium uptake protein TrkH